MTRLFHVSDLHFGREDRAALDWFAQAVADERPDAVVCTGDLTQQARAHEFAAATAWLEALPVPVTVEPGNHDLPYFNPYERFVRPYRRYGRLERMIERPLDVKNVVIVPLKTTTRFQFRYNWSWGVVTRRALAKTLACGRTRKTKASGTSTAAVTRPAARCALRQPQAVLRLTGLQAAQQRRNTRTYLLPRTQPAPSFKNTGFSPEIGRVFYHNGRLLYTGI